MFITFQEPRFKFFFLILAYLALILHCGGSTYIYLRAAAPAADPGRTERIPEANPACYAAKLQHAVRKRAAASSAARLEPLRKRFRHRGIIRETWEAIAANKNARAHDHSTDPVEMRSADMASAGLLQASSRENTAAAEYVYACPFCKGVVTSPVATGHINHRRICGKQFRVENGFVRPTLHYVHTCPTCGSCIHSTKESGRIRSKHKQANGRMCPRTEWQLK